MISKVQIYSCVLALEKLTPNFSLMHNIILKIQSGIVNWLFVLDD